MRTLYLLRHAKSSWKDDSLADFDRPLKRRGKHTTRTLAAFFRKRKLETDLIISSPAVRARQTIERILKLTKSRVEPSFDERIYEATADTLLKVLTEIEKGARSVVLVGHNPGLEELLSLLTGQVESLPTGALVKITFADSNWNRIGSRKGKLEWVVTPKELEKS